MERLDDAVSGFPDATARVTTAIVKSTSDYEERTFISNSWLLTTRLNAFSQSGKCLLQFCLRGTFAFPYSQYAPAHAPEFPIRESISQLVASKLWSPIALVGKGGAAIFARMPVPEATTNLNR